MVVAICGEPVVGRTLALLLGGSNYDARFLTASSLGEPGSLEGVRLLVLTPTWELDADSVTVKVALTVPLFPSVTDTSLIEMVGGGASSLVKVP